MRNPEPTYYAARAREYERIYHKPERQADLARLREAVPAPFTNRTVLEVACGTGYWTQHMARTARSICATHQVNTEPVGKFVRAAGCLFESTRKFVAGVD